MRRADPERVKFIEDRRAETLEKLPHVQFLIQRLDDEEQMIRTRLAQDDDVLLYFIGQLTAKRVIVQTYLDARAQSVGENRTLWGSETRLGLETALDRLLRTYKAHPDYQNDWM